MNAFHIRTLQADDAERLLRFEQDNRDWFERHIAPRAAAFYSPDGVRAHVRSFLDAHAKGTLHPCLVFDAAGAVIGRANLKDIDRHAGTAEVGYRIAASCAGQGVATGAVHHLLGLARSAWQLRQLLAYVGHRNAASARVLEKCRFTRYPFQHERAAFDGAAAAPYKFSIDLDVLDPGETHGAAPDRENDPRE